MNPYPSRAVACETLEWAAQSHPGRWVEHSQNVARAAELIAAPANLTLCHIRFSGFEDAEQAYAQIEPYVRQVGAEDSVQSVRPVSEDFSDPVNP